MQKSILCAVIGLILSASGPATAVADADAAAPVPDSGALNSEQVARCKNAFSAVIDALRFTTRKSLNSNLQGHDKALSYAANFLGESYASMNQHRGARVYLSSSFIDSHDNAAASVARLRDSLGESQKANIEALEEVGDALSKLVRRCVN